MEILREVVVPQLQTKPNFDELFFQQDGAPPRFALRVRDYHNALHSVGLEEEVALNGHHSHLPRHQWISFLGCCKKQDSLVKDKV